jgi:hypothetical protein
MATSNNIDYADVELKMRPQVLKDALNNNKPCEDKLHVIMVTSNPCEFKKRWKLAEDFKIRMLQNPDIILYVVETIYPGQTFHVTESNNPLHLQLKTEHPLWAKENMISLGVKYLLPPKWKAMAWIDADLKFENPNWAIDALKILNGHKDIIQLYSHCLDMDALENSMNIWRSFGYQYVIGTPYSSTYKNPETFYNPGFAWACTREAYKQMGGIFQYGILGSGDDHMAKAVLGCDKYNEVLLLLDNYRNKLIYSTKRCNGLRLGYTPGVIRHYWHGSKENRRYLDRWQILKKYNYSPDKHITFDEKGILIPSKECPQGLLDEIMQYFKERLEDD